MSKDIRQMIDKVKNFKQFVNENVFRNENLIKELLKKLDMLNYKILGIGQHGAAIHNLEDNKVYKFTTSKNEIKIAKELLYKNFTSLPVIYKVSSVDGIDYYIRDVFFEIDEELAEKIDEEIEDIQSFFYEKNMDVRKSNTNLEYYFDGKFLNFLNVLKKDLFNIGIKDDFDIEGLSLNLYQDKNSNFILVDF